MSRELLTQPDTTWPTEQVIAEIRTTFSSRHDAVACGNSLIERGLVACVQIEGPLTSIYRWQGAMETVEEFCCRCKTTPTAAPACEAAIMSLHPYDTPAILLTFCCGSTGYAAWVRETVAASAEPHQ
jgi:periplasmic divalent cation tolerance protein